MSRVVGRPVEWIDDPHRRRSIQADVVRAFLAQEAMMRETRADDVGDRGLGGEVGVGDDIARPLDAHLALLWPQVAQQVAGRSGGLNGGRKKLCHVCDYTPMKAPGLLLQLPV